MSQVTYPQVRVQLTGVDGNAFAIIGAVSKAIKREVGAEAAEAFTKQAFEAESYDALLQLVTRTVDAR